MRASSHISRNAGKNTFSNYDNYHIEEGELHSHNGNRQYKKSNVYRTSSGRSSSNEAARNQVLRRGISYEDKFEKHSSNDDEQNSSPNEMRKTANTLHQILNRRKEPDGISLKSVDNTRTQETRTSVNETVIHVIKNGLDNKASEKENLKHIILTPDHRSLSGNENSGVELCKKLFGITVFEYSNGKSKWDQISKDRKLVVQGVIEGSTSYFSGKIHRGDMLVRINDVDVSWHNFTRSLNSLNKRKKVKLTFQSPRIVGPKSFCDDLEIPESDLCIALSGKPLSEIQSELSQLNCVALYLTLVKSSNEAESNEKEDVIYAFPPDEQRLMALRGLFITLSSSLVDVVNQPAFCSNLVLNGSIVNVAYKQFGSDVLVFVMPEDRISSTALAASLDSFCSLIMLIFSDVKRNWVDKVLAFMFYEALGLSCLTSADKMIVAVKDYHIVKMLTLSHENQLLCDEIMSEFEALDFDDYLDSQDLFSRRRYSVQGTCLYYKDYLLSSHVPVEQQRKINLFMNCHGLLVLSSQHLVDHIVMWQELKSCSSQDTSLFPAGYRPTKTNSFIMIVGLNHYYLVGMIEAVGCSQQAWAQSIPVSLLVEQGKAALAQLETHEVRMAKCCEERLMNANRSVSLASVDTLFKLTSPRLGQDAVGLRRVSESQKSSLTPTKPFSRSPFFRSKSVDRLDDGDEGGNAAVMMRQGSKLSYGSNDSAGSGSSNGPSKSKGSRVSSVADISSIVRSQSFLQIDAPHDVLREGRLDRGRETTLFSFIYLDSAEGILISPTEAELLEVHSGLQQQILDNFSQTCHKMKALFSSKALHSDTNQCLFSTTSEDEDGHCHEVGILFCCTFPSASEKKRQLTTHHYWVVGRRWSSPRSQEMYVCFHESAHQSLVEMAFTLGFGI